MGRNGAASKGFKVRDNRHQSYYTPTMSILATRILWPVLLWCLCFAPAAGKEYWTYKTAYDAYDAGEFLLAADIYKRLAKNGEARSQNDLGFMYSIGQGVQQDFKTAIMWYEKSAQQGYAKALMNLAGLYVTGRGVLHSTIEAHKYYNLASLLARKNNRRHIAVSRRNEIANRLTATQLSTARERACRWWQLHRIQKGKSPNSLPLPLQHCAAN